MTLGSGTILWCVNFDQSISGHWILILCCLCFLLGYQPFTYGFPRADIHELLSPDLLHQLIKGTFKDHLVTWVGDYLIQTHGQTKALEIIEDIDHR
jgi:hypothetical protein